MVRRIGGLLLGAFLAFSSVAGATPSAEDKALSTQLFEEGRRLLVDGKVAEACAKFAESERLVHADGTLLNLAVCNEKLGNLATAYAAFIDARARARASNRPDRVKLADEHIAAIEPRLSRLTIVVSSEADVPGLRIYRDGRELGRAAWGTAMPVDPGPHVVEARAEGRRTWTTNVEMRSDADQQSVEVHALEIVAPPEPKVEPAPAPVAVVTPSSPRPSNPPPVRERKPFELTQQATAVIVGGVGVVGIGVGSYFGLRAFSKWSESDDACRGGHCTAEATEAADDARTAADVSTVSFVLGGAALAVGTWLFFSASDDEKKTGAVFVRAGYGAGGPSTALGTLF